MKCRVLIDESGDPGIRVVRSNGKRGASPYFVMAAAVIPSSSCTHAKSILDKVEAEIPKNWKHATDLNHVQTVYFARQSSQLTARFLQLYPTSRL